LPPQAIPAIRERMIRNTPMHRMGTPEEVAAAVLLLTSSESASF
jgi:NAD(P)-dependent dehydrogenase (short-subunit alcohol dehydrogenase family)